MTKKQTRGYLTYAFDTAAIAYGRIAELCAMHVKKFTGENISVVVDEETVIDESLFDKVIRIPSADRKSPTWRNRERHGYLDHTPYDLTVVIDSDYFLLNDNLNNLFRPEIPFTLSRDAIQINEDPVLDAERRLNNVGIDMIWGTCFYFNKHDPWTKLFFEFLEYVRENYEYFAHLYRFYPQLYRNDFVFSVAYHHYNAQKQHKADLNPFPLYTAYRHIDIASVTKDGYSFFDPKGLPRFIDFRGLSVHVLNKHTILKHYDSIRSAIQ